jgi:hypothetical protein
VGSQAKEKQLRRSITIFARKYLFSAKLKTVWRSRKERISMDIWLFVPSHLKTALKSAGCQLKRKTSGIT